MNEYKDKDYEIAHLRSIISQLRKELSELRYGDEV